MSVALTQTVPYTGIIISSWALANAETGNASEASRFSDRSVQFNGTYGSGGSVLLEGSNNGVNFFPLHDYQGNAIVSTAASLSPIAESVRYIRPRCTAGDGTTAVVVTIHALQWGTP